MPRLTHILVQVRPRPGSRNMQCGGAFINCWISYPDLGGALAVAKHYLRDYGWIFVRAAEYQYVMRSDYRNHPNLPYFDEAAADGASFVVHTFPKRRTLTGAPRTRQRNRRPASERADG